MFEYDLIVVGGGLQGGLFRLAMSHHQPALRMLLIERAPTLGGNHTWCFHADDLGGDNVFAPLVEFSWPGYDVLFANEQARTLNHPYRGLTSAHLDRVARLQAPDSVTYWMDTEVGAVGEHSVTTVDGRKATARLVIDARGASGPSRDCGYQKFVGIELQLEEPHGLVRPTLMDARVQQLDGFRFFYLLPLSATRVLVEDTYFSNDSLLDADAVSQRVNEYVTARGWEISEVIRTEQGVLPMPWKSASRALAQPLVAGYRGQWFHPATGYSFPVAARLANALAQDGIDDFPGPRLRDLFADHCRQARVARLLNRLAFQWFDPAQRWRPFARFYRMPEDTIRRFYALQLTKRDHLRLFLGKPPSGFSLRSRLRFRAARQ